jgi:hypothetical protein
MRRQHYRSSILEAALLATRHSLSLEEEKTDGKAVKEIEHMFYGRVSSPADLLKATTVEIQEQWGIWQDKTDKNAGCGSIRIRKSIIKDIVDGVIQEDSARTQYVQTTKIKTSDGAAIEVPVAATEDGFKAIKLLAESGMVKHRYCFPIAGTDMKWEVDAFPIIGSDMSSTTYYAAVKIDLEVTSKEIPIPPFPEGITHTFDPKDPETTATEQVAMKKQLDELISLPNPHLKSVYKGV